MLPHTVPSPLYSHCIVGYPVGPISAYKLATGAHGSRLRRHGDETRPPLQRLKHKEPHRSSSLSAQPGSLLRPPEPSSEKSLEVQGIRGRRELWESWLSEKKGSGAEAGITTATSALKEARDGSLGRGAQEATMIIANMVHSQTYYHSYFQDWIKQRRLTEEAICFIFEPNACIASLRFALKEEDGIALLAEEERRLAICHGTCISKTCCNEVDIGGNKRSRFTKFGIDLSTAQGKRRRTGLSAETRGTSSVNKCDACWLQRRVAAWWK
ncbi:hypothetical protein Q8A73_008273 [Channa argus]|nr:hypothetical protein Q8A73_008273 [Channa argus]